MLYPTAISIGDQLSMDLFVSIIVRSSLWLGGPPTGWLKFIYESVLIAFPTFNVLFIPTPPETINAPVVLLVEVVVSNIFVIPLTFNVPVISKLAVGFVLPIPIYPVSIIRIRSFNVLLLFASVCIVLNERYPFFLKGGLSPESDW